MNSSVPAAARVEAEAPCGLHVLLAYENISAALWAAESLTNLFRRLPLGPQMSLSPWSFAMLADLEFRARAAEAAVDSDLLVVATSSDPRLLPAAVESWLTECLCGQTRAISAVAAFLGREGLFDGADSPRLKTVQRLAKRAGCEFFAPHAADADGGLLSVA